MDENLLQDRNRVHRIANLAPGLLSSMGMEAMKPFLLQMGGSGWESEGTNIPPLLSLYSRTYVSPKLSGGVQREFVTLAWIGDLMLQGRISEATDTVLQRMKSIELVSKGEDWRAAQKLELAPPGEATMTQRSEKQIAHKEQKLDQQAKGANTNFDKGKGKTKERWQERGEKGKDRGKGKSKEGDGKKSA